MSKKLLDIRYTFKGRRWKIPAFSLLWWTCVLASAAIILSIPFSLAVIPYILFI